jgi:hypothetical protein
MTANDQLMLRELLKSEAILHGLMKPEEEITAEKTFLLVRDMPYKRASSRSPETIIREWQGTCSGKHYLLKQLFGELGYPSQVIACTTIEQIDPRTTSGKIRELLEQSDGRFVDVHNYLILELPQGEMIVDATWPMSVQGTGLVVNESFVLGENQRIACEPLATWVVPEDGDPQVFKEKILKESFTEEELEHRDKFIQALGNLM